MKRIVFCADGTWDTAVKHTNVYKFFKALSVTADQMPFYDDGVGANGDPISNVLGGAFGTGLWQKIKEGYTKVAHVYEAGDLIYLYGFSRGAYTARSLAGMITACGLPTKNFSDDLVDTAFDAYRNKAHRKEILDKLKDNSLVHPEVKMVGVWDTVGSLGIPSALGAIDPILYGFLDTGLNPDVLNAYHALAIDEKRFQFPPTLWTSAPVEGQTLEQVWFTGVHSDVGGGEPDDVDGTTALSDITLAWMISKAIPLGLQFDEAVLKSLALPLGAEYSLDTLHTSWTIANGVPRHRAIPKSASIANSVVLRAQHDNTYRPSNLSFQGDALAPGYKIIDVVGELEAAVAKAGGD